MRRSRLFLYSVSLTCLFFFGVGKASAQTSDDFLARAVASWQRREQLVRSAQFELAVRQHIPKGAYTHVAKEMDPNAQASPPHDVDVAWKESFLFDGRQMRWESDRPKMMHPDWKPIPKTYVAAFNGDSSKSLTKAADETKDTGSIREDQGVPEAEVADVKPLMYAFRAFHEASRQLAQGKLIVTQDRPMVEGRQCVALKCTAEGLPQTVFWVDPTRGYSVVREYILRRGKVIFDLAITYSEHSDCGWMPTAWKAAMLQPDGAMRNHVEVTVVSSRINLSVPREAFDLSFPVGAVVRDEKGRRNAIVNEKGELETVDKWASAEPEQPTNAGSAKWWLGAGLVLCGITIFVLLRMRRRSSLEAN